MYRCYIKWLTDINFYQIDPCGECRIEYKAVSLDFTAFAGLHPNRLLDLKGKMRTWKYIEWVFWQ
jgi:hypothetical protein